MRVAVLGAGYAGLTLARRLEKTLPADVSLVVVDESGTHVLQHELHRVVRRPSIADDIAVPLSQVLDCEIRQATVTDVDPDAGRARLDGAPDLSYDVGAVCLGAATEFYDIPGLEAHATPLKRLAHARQIRTDFLDLLDVGGRVIVGGAGLSGIQVAGELAALAREIEAGIQGGDLVDEAADPARLPSVVLLEQFEHVAPGFEEEFQQAVADQLSARGVDIRTGATVTAVDGDVVAVDSGKRLGYQQLVWTGGIRGSAALGEDRPTVRSDLRWAGDTFLVGDAGRVVDANGAPVPASAQTALREARVVAKNVAELVDHRRQDDGAFEPRLDRYTYESPGWLVSVGDGAVAQVGDRILTGTAALALKTSVGAGYLGSVGAVDQAMDLVRNELGIAIDGDDDSSVSDSDDSTGEDEEAGRETGDS